MRPRGVRGTSRRHPGRLGCGGAVSAEVENLVLELFDLREDDESSNAEAARGRLDEIWHAVSVAERELLAGLLADLKMLRASDVPLDALKHRDAAELEEAALADARHGRWA